MGRDAKGEARSVVAWSRRDEDGTLIVDPKVEEICRARCQLDGFDPNEKIKISEHFTKGLHSIDYHTIYMRGWQMYVDEVESELKAPAVAPALIHEYTWTEYKLGSEGVQTQKVPAYRIDPWGAIEGDYNVKPTGK